MAGALGEPLGGTLTADGHHLPVRVYYEDTDFSGAVYHGSFVRFLERGRSEFLRAVGITHQPLAADGLHFVVAAMTLNFRRSAAIDDLLEIVTRPKSLSGVRAVLAQEVRRNGETILAAEVTVALIDREGRPRRFPDTILAPLRSVSPVG